VGLTGLIISGQMHRGAAPVQMDSSQGSTVLRAPLHAGLLAPDFQLSSAQGGTYHLLGHARVRLLAFLQTQPDTAAGLSRSQVTALISMQHQYAAKGVDVVVVDASALWTGETPDTHSLVNVVADWHLGTLPLLMDTAAHTTAQSYGVQHTPITFLIDTAGEIVQSWDGLARGAQLALALQQLVGPPLLSTPTS